MSAFFGSWLQFKAVVEGKEIEVPENELIQAVTTKRYPASRIARTLRYLLMGIDKESMALFDQTGPLYARLLAASPQGKNILREIKIYLK